MDLVSVTGTEKWVIHEVVHTRYLQGDQTEGFLCCTVWGFAHRELVPLGQSSKPVTFPGTTWFIVTLSNNKERCFVSDPHPRAPQNGCFPSFALNQELLSMPLQPVKKPFAMLYLQQVILRSLFPSLSGTVRGNRYSVTLLYPIILMTTPSVREVQVC